MHRTLRSRVATEPRRGPFFLEEHINLFLNTSRHQLVIPFPDSNGWYNRYVYGYKEEMETIINLYIKEGA